MAQKIFNRFGLRRELNLSDLPDSTAALNNILRTPSMIGTEESFTKNDLEPIEDIFLTNINLETFNGLADTTVEFTLIDDDGNITEDTIVYRPLIKIKTQLDASFFSAGEPFFFGGDGPNAFYYDSNKIIRTPEDLELDKEYTVGDIVLSNSAIYSAKRGAKASAPLTPQNANSFNFEFIRNWNGMQDIYFSDEYNLATSEIITINDQFWERGQFAFTSKIQSSFLSLFGGVNWKGFYKPTASGNTEFRINTTGSTIFKFQEFDSFSFQQVRYGKPTTSIMNTFQQFIDNPSLLTVSGVSRYNLDQIKEIKSIYDDATRQLVQVTYPKVQRLSHNDSIFVEVSEGQVKSRNYKVLSHRSGIDNSTNNGIDERGLIFFFIEVTKDFNLLGLNVNTLDFSGTGSSEDLSTGNITEATSESLQGLLATTRYSPYKRRSFKTYLQSTLHKLEIPEGTYTATGNTITCDDFYYKHLMENDYIYDYRRRQGDSAQGVRRFIVTGLDDNTNTATVKIDAEYKIVNNSPRRDNNDQFYYISQGNTSISGQYINDTQENPGLYLEKAWTNNTSSTMIVFGNDNNNVTFNNTTTRAISTVGVTNVPEGAVDYFEENNEYLVRFTNGNNAFRTFNYRLFGARGGGTEDTFITDRGYGRGARIDGTITFRRNVWYKFVIGKKGELGGISEVGGGGAAGSGGSGGDDGYSGGGYSGIHDLDLLSTTTASEANNEPLTQANMVVIAGGGGGGRVPSGILSPSRVGGDGGSSIGNGNGENGVGGGFGIGGGGGTIGGSGGSSGYLAVGDGSALRGGDGEDASANNDRGGGGGGGGYFGGGGGGAEDENDDEPGVGGGGGSAISVSILNVSNVDSAGSEAIRNVITEGTLGDTIDPFLNGIDDLLFVGRYGEDITRVKTISIDYFLQEFNDYAFDWAFYIKDEDINARSNNKIWTIRKRDQRNFFARLSYKFLYDIDYDFFKVGDFKNFAENSISLGGTSRETGIQQLAFGKPQLLEKGDQYNVFYSLLPIVSTYKPPINFNKVVRTGNATIRENSRVIVSPQFTDFEVGNYIIDNTLEGFRGDANTKILKGTRVIDLPASESGEVIISKDCIESISEHPYIVINHRGFVCTCTLDPAENNTAGRTAGSDILIRGQSSEVKVGMAVCVQNEPSKSTYTRITSISENNNGDPIVTLDSDLLSTSEIGALIYNDRGVDIIEPLKVFCNDTACGQNNYQGDKVKTKYITTIASTGARNPSLDVRWDETSEVGSYSSTFLNRPHRYVYYLNSNGNILNRADNTSTNFANNAFNTPPSVAWWVDANAGQTIDYQAIFGNGAPTAGNLNSGRGSKKYGSMQTWARFKKTGAGAYTTGIADAIIEKYPNFPIDDTFWPIGIAEGLIRINGDLRTNTQITDSHRYYLILRVNEKIKSVPNEKNGYTATWTDSTPASDGNTLLPVTLDLTEFSTDLWDLREIVYPQGTNQSDMRRFFGNISTESILNTRFTNQFNNPTNIQFRNHYYRITGAGFTISQASAEGKFLNPNSLIRDDGNGNITYELRPGEILAHIGDTGYWTHFDTLESAVDTQVAFTFKPDPIDGGVNNQSANESELINLFPGIGGKSATSYTSSDATNQLRYMQYRNENYEILPTSTGIQNRFPGIRMINPNTTTTYTKPDGSTEPVKTNLQNAINSLSVYTFTNTTEIRELCCPPLDTSPPFDSSEVGLSTTTSNPNMNIDGLINIRSFSANHPTDRILSIVTAQNSDLPVTEKLELLFGNDKYKLLIGDNPPTTL